MQIPRLNVIHSYLHVLAFAFMRRCAFPSWFCGVEASTHSGTVFQRALCLCPHGVAVCQGSSWPCLLYNKIPSPHTTLIRRTTVVVATASCNTTPDSGSMIVGC
eukprot:2557954-Pleurochrysis_carterae.AAC.7